MQLWSIKISNFAGNYSLLFNNRRGYSVEQLVEALPYKPEGCVFYSLWCHWNFLLTQIFRPRYGTWVDSTSERNENQDYFLGVKAAGA
jgi:hypothetical protein